MKDNKSKRYVIYGIILTLMLCIGFSVAYFTTRIVNDNTPVTIKAGELNIIFTDTTEIVEDKIRLDWTTSKTFTVENQSSKVFYYNIYIEDLINTLVTEGYLQYKITSSNGYSMSDYESIGKSPEKSNFTLAGPIAIEGGVTQEYTIEFRYANDPDVDQSADMGKKFGGRLMIEEETIPTLYAKILSDHKTVNTRTDFDNVFGDETPTTGVIYKESVYRETPESTGSENNNKDVYYFAGNVADNWVSFGGYMWRIIRTNEDGSVRLLYHGTSTTATDSYIATRTAFNGTYNNTMYVGYMYGTTGSIGNNRNNTMSSPIKIVIDNWYKTNILDKNYDGYVSRTAIYCNDRASSAYTSSGDSTNYAANERLARSKVQPTYQCGQNTTGSAYISSPASVADKFSASTQSGGNGKLTYPIALITADEVSYAGGKNGKGAPNSYYSINSLGGHSSLSNHWWTMSPNYSTLVFYIAASDLGYLTSHGVNNSGSNAVRPVLSLKSCVMWQSGDGTAESPYTVSVSDTCSAAVN